MARALIHHALHPERALSEAGRALRPGGRILVLDLLRHEFEAAAELYAGVWPGFSRAELSRMLREVGFDHIELSVVDREAEPPTSRRSWPSPGKPVRRRLKASPYDAPSVTLAAALRAERILGGRRPPDLPP